METMQDDNDVQGGGILRRPSPSIADKTITRRPDDVVTLDVRGTRTRVLRSTLTAGPPGSLLARLFACEVGPWVSRPQADGSHFIDDDPQDFEAVLCYLRYGVDGVRFDSATRAWRARSIAAYYMLDAMVHACALEALRAELRVAPACAVGSLLYAFEGYTDEVDSDVGIGLVPARVHFMRDWPMNHVCAMIAHEVGHSVDLLVFYCVDWVVRGCLADFVRYTDPIDVERSTGTVASFPLTRADHGGLLVLKRRPPGQTAVFCKTYKVDGDGTVTRAESDVAVVTVPASDNKNGTLDRAAVIAAGCKALEIDPALVVATYVEWMDDRKKGFVIKRFRDIDAWDNVWIVVADSPRAAAAWALDGARLFERAKEFARAANG
ncbi:BTB/POZ domain protein [Pandoravirus inopinatum]|uniref:BTB/POZ domain protein n=1 Tax=Pandoravirus inopinatum TaxID=1605721 RepID=A0A0B5IZY5_9VIRU|nr:BTB/POZ domain protein [Pandoravirus inopinatum]AJF98528.1 BTB/POZ domain protein [Pandoravirus inopinatum]